MRDRFLHIFIFGFVTGVVAGSFVHFGFALVFFSFILGLAVLAAPRRFSSSRPFFTVSVFLLALSLGLARVEFESYRYENILSGFENSRVTLNAVVSEFPDVRETNTHLILTPKNINEDLLVIAGLFPAFHYGDEVSLSGTIKPIENFSVDGSAGRHFDYKEYLSKDGIFHEMIYPEISVISPGKGNPILQKLFAFREKFSDSLRQSIREPEASLGLGMLIGEKHSLPQSLLDAFKRAGIIHLVVLSGYNIALVSQFFTKIFSFLPILFRASAGAIAIVLFVLMTGGGASAVRAAIMALIALLGIATGRTYDAGRALFIAGFLMLLENPNILIFDASFELSFLATLGLIYLTPVVSLYLIRVKPAWFRELLSQTISTQVAVLPLLIYMSGMISIVALLVNILVLPTVPFAMLGSFVTGFAGFPGAVIAAPFAIATSSLLSYTVITAEFFSSLPFAVLPTGAVSAWLMILSYVLLLGLFFKARSHANAKK